MTMLAVRMIVPAFLSVKPQYSFARDVPVDGSSYSRTLSKAIQRLEMQSIYVVSKNQMSFCMV